MDILIKAGQLFLSLSILILLHEFGHYIAARMFKTRVEKFYLFFNPWFEIFKFKKGETEYGLGWLPLGGYVKIAGMIDESMDKEAMKLPPQPYEFRSKPAWQRLIIMLGGIIMNVLLGIFIYWMLLFFAGEEYIPTKNLSYGIAVDSIGREMGFQNGDQIIAVDGQPVENFNKIAATIIIDMARVVTVQRNGETVQVPIDELMIKKVIDSKSVNFISARMPFVIKAFSPNSAAKTAGLEPEDQVIAINNQPAFFYDEVRNQLTENREKEIAISVLRNKDTVTKSMTLSADGLLGVQVAPGTDFMKTEVVKYSFFGALPAGINKAWETLANYVKQFALIFSSKVQGIQTCGRFHQHCQCF
jgi:regulator of sigma E protease